MAAEKYPIGIQTFSEIINGGFTYVDKTHYIPKLLNHSKYYFLSRPRRFGKSLFLSTLHAFFNGKRDLFKGLYVDKADLDWNPSPVLHFDLNSENFLDEDGLPHLLNRLLEDYERQFSISIKSDSISGRFARLIREAFERTGRKVVILVDEYDKPLLEIEDRKELFEKNQAILKGFFGNLKSMDSYIRFAFLTGVARFNKVSIFSDLNNINDISLNNDFADICGWTEHELTSNFEGSISDLSVRLCESYESTVGSLRYYYDGYRFSEEGSRLYNPYSVMLALSERRIEAFWFETGTPTFLARRVKESGIVLPDFDHQYSDREDLLEAGFDTGSPIGLMFQTGYLTIDYYDPRLRMYKLRFPNHEVEIGFARRLMPLYIPKSELSSFPFSLLNFKLNLVKGEPEEFMERLKSLLKSLPYESQNEDNYRNIVWLLCTLCDTDTLAERHSYRGRSDLEVKTTEYIYIFEFKYDRNETEAMEQIHSRDYAGQYRADNRKVFLIGANFSSREADRGLTGWKIEELCR